MTLRHWADDALTEATGQDQRHDPVLPGTGGPAGNARLTAWTGAVLLVLFLVELVTLLDLGGLIDWHIAVGTLLIPPALLKTGSTGWRILRYYTRRRPYVTAGPPPMLLRVLGPLVVLFTLAVLGSGLALVFIGPDATRTPFLQLAGYSVTPLTVHQGTFVLWAVVTGIHTLGRLVPAFRIMTGRRGTVPGRVPRIGLLGATLAVAGVTAALVLGVSGAWSSSTAFHHFGHHKVFETPGSGN
ncbi:MAG TPA: hypothetical protein VHF06_06340 [Pseudonocardiaceae bacterium]|nr:hypothetical protein [Pseudonocardiaceae bacterium]